MTYIRYSLKQKVNLYITCVDPRTLALALLPQGSLLPRWKRV